MNRMPRVSALMPDPHDEPAPGREKLSLWNARTSAERNRAHLLRGVLRKEQTKERPALVANRGTSTEATRVTRGKNHGAASRRPARVLPAHGKATPRSHGPTPGNPPASTAQRARNTARADSISQRKPLRAAGPKDLGGVGDLDKRSAATAPHPVSVIPGTRTGRDRRARAAPPLAGVDCAHR